MSVPWYREYFTEDYWAFAELEYSTECTAREIAYLQEVLKEKAPGRRVVDLGCGVGRHAIALAQAGFEVTGLDVSEWAIGEAKRRSVQIGVDVRWEIVDLLAIDEWPLSEVDAAICVQAFGWGSDADQRRLLRRIRRYLAPDGIVLLAQPDALWVIHNFAESGSTTVGDVVYSFRQRYDPVSGRSKGSAIVSSPGQADRVLPHDLRLYTTAELIPMVREAGFAIDRLDGDFTAGCPIGAATRCIQLVARSLPVPPAALAVASWRTPTGNWLDLRYTSDEAEWLNPSPDAIWDDLLTTERRRGADAIGFYPVDDPYGGERAAEVVTQYFGCPVPHHLLTFGAGVTPLLRDLSGLADRSLVLASLLSHPDVEAWAIASGSEVRLLDDPLVMDRLIAEIDAKRPTLVHLDRPTYAGDLITLPDLEAVARAAARVGATVLVDESASSYLGPGGSSVPLIHRLDNLVVLRSLTKAYSWGGLRVGYAVASGAVAARVRELVPPLQVGELAFRAVLRLLAAGDIFGGLRARIGATKPGMIASLESLGLEVIKGHPALPWVLVRDVDETASRLLEYYGIRGLRLIPSPALHAESVELLHLSVPLSDERIALFRELLGC